MKVRTRLLLFGAALPTVALLVTVLLAGQAFRLSLLHALDRALISQAAVESVSLFDGPAGEPHLHLTASPLAVEVRAFAPTVGLFGPGGDLLVTYGKGPAPARPAEGEAGAMGELPKLQTRPGPDGKLLRELAVRVRSPQGKEYTLKLASPLAEIDATLRTYHQTTLAACAAVALALLGIQAWQASRMSRRLGEMAAYLPELKGGDLVWRLPPDTTGDEIAALRGALEEAMRRLHTARAAQERLIANAAHELKTPLGLMRTEMDLALRKERPAPELREALFEARREVDRLAALASRLLDLAALGGVAWVPSRGDLALLVREAAETAEAEAARRGVRLLVVAPAEVPAVMEALTLRQAVDNMLANALRFAPAGSSVTLALDVMETRHRISVRDEGPGVPRGEEEKIFEPFQRGASAQAGTHGGAGLGLAIVREIARKHGGHAYLARDTDVKGATFVLEIPRD
ncbi:sensor histidine kinase [Chondromyces crocatus]|uniref:histidine kinase n=1 Tax=Chondromyces crocatus TaxID=52 RepID=A0A0K1ER09_CHOCO|nr:HAMP domain-containing sensor histidine kinase [Chondromyces crocatus]AKT43072.1 histidine kinase [Chondromyces crocatus]